MKRICYEALRTLPAILLLFLCALYGCNSNAPPVDAAGNESENSISIKGKTEEPQNIIGQVTYVASSYLSITVYHPSVEVEDMTLLDTADLTVTEEAKSITTGPDTEYYRVRYEGLETIPREEVEKGGFIASIMAEDQTHQIILLKAPSQEGDEPTIQGGP